MRDPAWKRKQMDSPWGMISEGVLCLPPQTFAHTHTHIKKSIWYQMVMGWGALGGVGGRQLVVEGWARNMLINVFRCQRINTIFKNEHIVLIISIYNKDLGVTWASRIPKYVPQISRWARFIRSISLASRDLSRTFLVVQSEATSPQARKPVAAVQPGLCGLSFDLASSLHIELFNLSRERQIHLFLRHGQLRAFLLSMHAQKTDQNSALDVSRPL